MSLIQRNENGKISFKRLNYQIFIDETLEESKTPEEMQWIYEQLKENLECEFAMIMENDYPDFDYEV